VPLVDKLSKNVRSALAVRGGKPVESARKILKDMGAHLTQTTTITTKWVGNATRGDKIWSVKGVGGKEQVMKKHALSVLASINQIDAMVQIARSEICVGIVKGLGSSARDHLHRGESGQALSYAADELSHMQEEKLEILSIIKGLPEGAAKDAVIQARAQVDAMIKQAQGDIEEHKEAQIASDAEARRVKNEAIEAEEAFERANKDKRPTYKRSRSFFGGGLGVTLNRAKHARYGGANGAGLGQPRHAHRAWLT
jgi:hypothetical protein